jgi:hypothetical protein
MAAYLLNTRYTEPAVPASQHLNLSHDCTYHFRPMNSASRVPLDHEVNIVQAEGHGGQSVTVNLQLRHPLPAALPFKVMEGGSFENAVHDSTGEFTKTLYVDADLPGYFLKEGDGKEGTGKDSSRRALHLKTTNSALQLYMGTYTGIYDVLRCRSPGRRLHHWAMIEVRVHYEVVLEDS